MSILIKGMEMPTSCMDCPFKGFDRARGRGNVCTINDSITLHAVLDGIDVKFVRMGDCPLVPVPSAQLERKRGEWIRISDEPFADRFECSECGKLPPIENFEWWLSDYCPHCGAEMKGEKK